MRRGPKTRPGHELSPAPPTADARRIPALLDRFGHLPSAGAMTVVSGALSLVATLGTGVLVARVLGPEGRGEYAAVLTSSQLVGWLCLLGSTQTISYFRAREPENAAALLGTWLALLVPLTIVAIVVGQALLPILLSEQASETLRLARMFMLTVGFTLLTETTLGFVLGAEQFLLFNLLRVLNPGLIAVACLTGWALDSLTVSWAVWSFAGVQAIIMVAVTILVARRYGVARPDRALARRTLWYGVRAHGTTVSLMLNTRLDLMLLPAFVPASSVGLYSVAANVSLAILVLSGAIAAVVLPVATRMGPDDGVRAVLRNARLTFFVAAIPAGVIAAAADPLVRAVFGPDFSDCVAALRMLLPGVVLYAVATVFVSGLYAADRPFVATCVQSAGLLLTVLGLLLFLRGGSIEAAAAISTVAYAVVFVLAVQAYRRVCGIAWREFVRASRGSPVGA